MENIMLIVDITIKCIYIILFIIMFSIICMKKNTQQPLKIDVHFYKENNTNQDSCGIYENIDF